MLITKILSIFPDLEASGFAVTSPESKLYNCIAWAAGDTENWWWPSDDPELDYWPAGIERKGTLANFVRAFEGLGYEQCADDSLEIGFEKIALYTDPNGAPQHAARQLPSGRWTSKLGYGEDIEHHTLDGLSGEIYGMPSMILKRPTSG